MTDKVLVESSMVILTSKEFQDFLANHNLNAQISGKGGTWQSGAPHMVSTEAQEIASATLDFNQPVSLAKFKAAIDASMFRYSLYHYRRPGQPIGTTIEYNEATDRAAAAAAKAQQSVAAQPAIKPAQQIAERRLYVAYPIDAEKFTGSPLTEDPVEVPFEIQQTDEGLYYVDYMDKDQGKYTYWRTEGKDRELLRSAVVPRVRKIEAKLEGNAAA